MLRVAIIDGNAISRDLLSTLLVNGGHEVVGTGNTSPAGVARVIKLQPQVVCIDIGHDDPEGAEAFDMVQKELPKALIFMVSGKFDAETVKNGAQRGVRGFIVKPFNPTTVLNVIRRAVLKLAQQQKTDASS
jgi:DNA-binding NarL/FixJ family response regulator